MASKIISISKQEGNNDLFLKDNEGHSGKDSITTQVKPGDTVTWKLVPDGGIDQIINITAKPGTGNIFSEIPAPINPDDPKTDWKGTVDPNARGNEAYSIKYRIGDNQYLDDPELEVDDDG